MLIWEFDFDGIFHLVQIVGLAVLVVGRRAALYAGGGQVAGAAT